MLHKWVELKQSWHKGTRAKKGIAVFDKRMNDIQTAWTKMDKLMSQKDIHITNYFCKHILLFIFFTSFEQALIRILSNCQCYQYPIAHQTHTNTSVEALFCAYFYLKPKCMSLSTLSQSNSEPTYCTNTAHPHRPSRPQWIQQLPCDEIYLAPLTERLGRIRRIPALCWDRRKNTQNAAMLLSNHPKARQKRVQFTVNMLNVFPPTNGVQMQT